MNTLLLIALLMLQAEGPPFFTVTTIEGPPQSGRLLQLREDGSVTLGGEQNQQIRGSDVVSLRRGELALPSYPIGEQILLANGDRLPGTMIRLFNERLLFDPQLGDGPGLTVPLSSLALLWLAAPDAEEGKDLWQRLTRERRARDQVHLRNGDVVEGTLTALEMRRFRVEQNGKEQVIDADKVAAIALSSQLTRTTRPRGTVTRVVMTNGARVTLSSASTDGEFLRGSMTANSQVKVPLQAVVRLDVLNSRVVPLSDLKPKAFEHQPYLGVSWPWTADRAVSGRELRLGGNTHDKGIGMHSASRITYQLDGRYRWFEALVGLDDDSGRSGSVQVRVLVDGKPATLDWNGELNGGERPQALRVGVRGAKELTLEVLLGRRGDVQDHVNWADARLLR